MKMISKTKFEKLILVIAISIIAMTSFTFADWVQEQNGRYRFLNDSTGQYIVNNWMQTGNGFYYFDEAGLTVTGWRNINGAWYYFNQSGLMQTGFQEINGETYYLDAVTGKMVTGWVQTYENGVVDYYYFDQNGAEAKGWKQVDNKWYYFYDGKCIVNTFAQVNGIWYHFSPSGAMDTGWYNINGKMYFFNLTNGSLTKGWIQDQNGNEYYLSEVDGSLVVNMTINIAGVSCTFDATGKCIAKDATATAISGQYGQGVLGSNLQATVYGVNVGISPEMNQMNGVVTSMEQQYINAQGLEAGSTAGPK